MVPNHESGCTRIKPTNLHVDYKILSSRCSSFFLLNNECFLLKVECEGDPTTGGNCGGAFQRYYFNKATYTCDPFIYGGCGATNVHDTKEACLDKCGDLSKCI